MTTEILGFIIILGAVIVLLARQHLNKSEDDPEVLEAATGRLRYELEEIAKATGLGIGAVHLIKQLQEKHQ